MAHPYSTEARLKRPVAGKSERLLELLDRNRDGIEDTDGTFAVLSDALERTANDIDSRLGPAYEVPFATATPSSSNGYAPTYGLVADLCDLGTKAALYEWLDPDCSEAEKTRAAYEKMLAEILDGTRVIPDAPRVDAGTGRRSFAYESIGTEYASGTTDGTLAPYTTSTTDPTSVL